MLNEVLYSEMNQGLIITVFDDVNPDNRSFWFINDADSAGYHECFFEQVRPLELSEMGGEFLYSIVNDRVVAESDALAAAGIVSVSRSAFM